MSDQGPSGGPSESIASRANGEPKQTDRVAPNRISTIVWVILAVIAITNLTILATIWRRNPPAGSLEFELAKVCMQVLGVAVIGSLAAIATFLFQRRRIETAETRVKQREERREDWRRDVENRTDERHRQDQLLRTQLEQTVAAYNAVKRTRRLLDAETGGEVKHISIDIYDRHLADLNNEQLVFESLKRNAPLIDEQRLIPTLGRSLADEFKAIEGYLNKVLDEYRRNRHVVAAAKDGMPLSQLQRAYFFVGHVTRSTASSSNQSTGFPENVSGHVDYIIETLQRALLMPLQLPSVDEARG